MRGDDERLRDILEAIERIERYAKDGHDRFESDELVQSWMVSNLQVVGEACARLSEDTKERRPDLPWREAIGTRNILVHGYFMIDLGIVWRVVTRDLPVLKQGIEEMLGSVSG